MQQIYDVIVIGLGAMGSATLYQLAKRGVQVLGIDQYHPPHAYGSTHGESRITRLATGEGVSYVPFAKRSHEIWRELEAASGEELLFLSGGLILCPQGGGAQFHGRLDFVEHSAAIASASDIAHELLDAESVRARWPQLRITDREHAYYEPTGGIVAVDRAVSTQLSLAKKLGAVMQLGEKVIAYQSTDGGVTVTTDKATYRAKKLIISAGAWINEFMPPEAKALFSIYRQVIYWFAVDQPRAFDVDHFPFLIWIGDRQEEFYSAFPYETGGTVGLKMVTEEYIDTTTPQTVDRTVHAHEIERMYDEFATRRINGIRREILKTGVCLYTNTPDEHFVLDYHPESQNVLVASPCSGHGFKHSAAIGEVLAQVATEGKSDLDISMFGFSRLSPSK